MKILSIYADIRNSSSLDIEEKSQIYTKLHNQFSSYNPKTNNIYQRKIEFIGDGILIIYKANSLNNKKEIINLLYEIDRKISNFEDDNDVDVGIGISYGEAIEGGNSDLLFSNAIDASAHGSKISNKNEMPKWVLPLKKGDKNSIDELRGLLENSLSEEDLKVSSSKKNLWFSFKN